LLKLIGDVCGVQAVVAGVDYHRIAGGGVQVVSMPREFSGPIVDWVAELVSAGAGEILLHAIDADGTGCGFDIEIARQVSQVAPVPVIASGGAGSPVHFEELFTCTLVAGGAAGNLFSFCEQSLSYVKGYLSSGTIPIRIEGIPSYTDCQFDVRGRPLGKGDEALAALRFKHIEDELP
jgi:cyclase